MNKIYVFISIWSRNCDASWLLDSRSTVFSVASIMLWQYHLLLCNKFHRLRKNASAHTCAKYETKSSLGRDETHKNYSHEGAPEPILEFSKFPFLKCLPPAPARPVCALVLCIWIYWHPNHKCIDINHISRDTEWSDRTYTIAVFRFTVVIHLCLGITYTSTLMWKKNKSHKENVSTSQFIWNICIESIKYMMWASVYECDTRGSST